MTLILTGPALGEPVTLTEAKSHLRLETSDEDALINSLIKAARAHCEALTGLALMTQNFRLLLDGWPETRVIQIPKSPVQTIDSVSVYNIEGVPQPVTLSGIALDGHARPARLLLKEMPTSAQEINGIEIDFTAGFGTENEIPPELKRAMLLHVAVMFELRGAVSEDMQPAGVPQGYAALISPWVRRTI